MRDCATKNQKSPNREKCNKSWQYVNKSPSSQEQRDRDRYRETGRMRKRMNGHCVCLAEPMANSRAMNLCASFHFLSLTESLEWVFGLRHFPFVVIAWCLTLWFKLFIWCLSIYESSFRQSDSQLAKPSQAKPSKAKPSQAIYCHAYRSLCWHYFSSVEFSSAVDSSGPVSLCLFAASKCNVNQISF